MGCVIVLSLDAGEEAVYLFGRGGANGGHMVRVVDERIRAIADESRAASLERLVA